MRKVFRGFGLSLVTFGVLAILAEVGTRVYLDGLASEEVFRKYATIAELQARGDRQQRYVRHYYLGHVPSPDYVDGPNRHDSRGFRGNAVVVPKPAGEFRVACLGASTTYTVDLEDFTKSYPAVFERELRSRSRTPVSVVNAGVPGWQSFETLAGFAFRVLDVEPDLVVVYHGVNDVSSRLTWPSASYTGDNRSLHSPPSQILWPSVFEHSALLRSLMIRSGRIQSHANIDRAFGGSSPDYHGVEFIRQKLSGSYPSGIFARVSAKEMLAANPPVYYRRNLENLVALAKANGVEIVLATFASCPNGTKNPQAMSEEYRGAFTEMNDVVRQVAEKTGANFFDFASVFPREPRYFGGDGIHMNEEGAALKGRLFAEFLVDRGLVPRE